MKVLGIETSCDETAAAVVENGKTLLSNVIASSVDLQAVYGGVVPEIAARSHIESIMPVINQALSETKTSWKDIDAIAVTQGPGLGGSLLVGVMAARTLAIIKQKPLYAINHVEAHIYSNFLTENQPKFPLLALIVSGGHSQIVLMQGHFKYQVLGRTQDDALGEAFDKVAKILGLPYPGGPSISQHAKAGNPVAYKLPKADMQKPYDMSFSGLKTAVLRTAQKICQVEYDYPSGQLQKLLNKSQKADLAASFQKTAIETVVDKLLQAYEEFAPKSVVIAGGVAANHELRDQVSHRLPIIVNYPDIKLCTDNGAMIAALGCYKLMKKQKTADPYKLDIAPGLSM